MSFAKIIISTLIFFSLFFYCQRLSAEQVNLELVAGLPKPPYIVEEQGRGMQLDIVREALAMSNKTATFIHMPFGRNITGFHSTNADGVITVLPSYEHPSLNPSKPYII